MDLRETEEETTTGSRRETGTKKFRGDRNTTYQLTKKKKITGRKKGRRPGPEFAAHSLKKVAV